MIFIGVISTEKVFDNLYKIMQRRVNKNEISLININKKSIDNLKNVKFETLVFINEIEKNEDNIQEIFNNVKYLIINADILISNKMPNIKTNIISYGLNHRATVTFSSITDERILISVQREFINKVKQIVEVGEYNFKIQEGEIEQLSEILVTFIIKKLYFSKNNE